MTSQNPIIGPPPIRDPVTVKDSLLMTPIWFRWINNLFNLTVTPPFPVARAFISGNQTGIANNTATLVAYNATTYDPTTAISTSSSSFTPNIYGTYKIFATVNWITSAATYTNTLYFYVNGSPVSSSAKTLAYASGTFTHDINDQVVLNAGDIVTVFCQQNSGSTGSLTGGSAISYFAAARVQ